MPGFQPLAAGINFETGSKNEQRMLIPIDGSECAMKAVRYAAEHFSGLAGLEITLLHVLPVPAIFWDEGHMLSEEEKKERRRFFEQWRQEQRRTFEPAFREAYETLVQKGIKPGQIIVKEASDTVDAADRILDETRTGAYQTLLIGHCKHDRASHFLRGSVTLEIIHKGPGATLSIIE